MSKSLKFSEALKDAQQDAITTACGASAVLKLYSGTKPADPDEAIGAQVLLAQLTCDVTFAPASSGGAITLNAITDTVGEAGAGSGINADFFRLETSGGTAHVDGTVGVSIANNITASIAGGLLDVTVLDTNDLAVGHKVTGVGVPANTYITAFGTGLGGVGTYYISTAATVASTAMAARPEFDLQLNNANIASGQAVSITSAIFTNPN